MPSASTFSSKHEGHTSRKIGRPVRGAADEYGDWALLDQQAERMACRIGEDIEGFALIV